MIGIYKITNAINGKIYIGQSINIQRRWNQEKNKAFNQNDPAYNQLLSQAFRKYGVDNFTFEIIEKLSTEALNEREEYWINYFNSKTPGGYNAQSGGRYIYTPNPFASSVLTLDDVEEIKELLRTTNLPMSKIAEEYKVGLSTINDIAKGRTWFDKSLTYPLRATLNFNKEVGQYSKNGSLIAIYPSIAVASRKTGINASSISTIAKTKGEGSRKTAGGYMWRIIEELDNPEQIEPVMYICDNQNPKQKAPSKTARGKAIGQYTKDGQFVEIYECMKDAAEKTGITLKNISAVISGKNRTAGGYIWKIEE